MATITVDGQTIEAPAGAPLVEVLKRNGFYVPNLCYLEGLRPYAGCRTCLVDIEGPPGLQLSCSSIVQDKMVVRTNTEEVQEARRAVVSIILANHSDRCLTCHRREHCHPGDICLRDDVVTHRCLTCSKNYRCELQATCEMVGSSGFEPWVGEERSWYLTEHSPADRGNPFMEFDPQMCILCTRCQRACEEKRHTGAITLGGRGWDARIAFGAGGPIHESNCDFAGACIDVCPTAALMEHPNKWVARPDRWVSTTCDSCAIGCSIKIGSKDGRGAIVRPGTGNALSGDQICVRGRYHYDSLKAHERLSTHQVRRGQILVPTAFEAAINEAADALRSAAARGKVGVLVGGTATVEEGWLASRLAKEAFGTVADSSLGPVMRAVKGALEQRLGTWRMATDLTRLATARAIVVVADDLEESHNVASVRVKDAVVNRGAKLVVVGALRSELGDFAAFWLRPAGGEEGQMAAALADTVAGGVAISPDVAAAAAILKDAPRDETLVVCAPNPVSPVAAGAMAAGAANLAVALFGMDASSSLAVLPPEVNVNGLLDVGIGANEGRNPLEGLAGLLVFRDDPTMRLPGAAADLLAIGSVVAIDSVLHPAAAGAAVVVAGGQTYATAGTYTQADFRAQRLEPAVQLDGAAVTGIAALHALGKALGVALPSTPESALAEFAKSNPAYQPVSDLIVGEGWRLDVAPGARATVAPVGAASVAGDSLRVITGRDLFTALDAAALRHPEAEKLHRYDRIQVSERDAERMDIRSGDQIDLTDGTISLRAPAWVTERVPDGCVYVSSLLQGGAVVRFFRDEAIPSVSVGTTIPA